MNITFEKDENLKYEKEIRNGLISFNKKCVGEPYSDTKSIYVMNEGQLVGGCQTEVGWNWLYIEAVHYENQNVLNIMMNDLYKTYDGKIEGVVFESYKKERVDAFLKAGFEVLGTFPEMPKNQEMHVLVNRNLSQTVEISSVGLSESYERITSQEPHEVYSKTLESHIKTYNKNQNIDESKVDIEFAAFDGEKLVGGVYGYITKDYLYVSRLWVDENYRGHNIATGLMDLIEKEANLKGYNRFYLGTCTFQAKSFYEKRGYEVQMIVPNCPEGYDDLSMIKTL